jgi:hypothetical protein
MVRMTISSHQKEALPIVTRQDQTLQNDFRRKEIDSLEAGEKGRKSETSDPMLRLTRRRCLSRSPQFNVPAVRARMDFFQKPAKTEVPGIRFGRDPSKVKFIGMMIHVHAAYRAGQSTSFYHVQFQAGDSTRVMTLPSLPLPDRHIFAPVP